MKKGYVVLLISLLIVVVVSSLITAADELCPVDNKISSTGCVCGHSPNTSLGYGQVIIGGAIPSIISCNNILDGVCPEDFTDAGGVTANCGSCPDPDCTVNNSLNVGYISGKVTDKAGKGVLGVLITGHPIKWNNSANLDRSAPLTDDYGDYNSKTFLSGKYFFSASKKGYDTQLVEVTVTRGIVNSSVNFILSNGTCYDDCTNSENRCSAACDGITFNDSGTKCTFFSDGTFPAPIIRTACDNQPKNSSVKLGQYGADENHTYFVKCCEEAPTLERYVKAKPDTSKNTVGNLVKTEKIAKRYGYPVRVVVAYWPKRTTTQ